MGGPDPLMSVLTTIGNIPVGEQVWCLPASYQSHVWVVVCLQVGDWLFLAKGLVSALGRVIPDCPVLL